MIVKLIFILLMNLKLKLLKVIFKKLFNPVPFQIIILILRMRIRFQICRKLEIFGHHPPFPHLIPDFNQIQEFKVVLGNQIIIEIMYESLSNQILVRIIQSIILFSLYNGKLLLMKTLWEEYLQRIHMSFICINLFRPSPEGHILIILLYVCYLK